MHTNAPQAAIDVLEKIASFGYAVQSSSSASTAATSNQLAQVLPDFPCDNLKLIAKMIESNPTMSATNAIHRLYPHKSFLSNGSSHRSVATLFDTLQINQHNDQYSRYRIAGIESLNSSSSAAAVAGEEMETTAGTKLCNGNVSLQCIQ